MIHLLETFEGGMLPCWECAEPVFSRTLYRAACGSGAEPDVVCTRYPDQVTCKRCKGTKLYERAREIHEVHRGS